MKKPPNYMEPGICAWCEHGEHVSANPYDFVCKKYTGFPVIETGVCDDYSESKEFMPAVKVAANSDSKMLA